MLGTIATPATPSNPRACPPRSGRDGQPAECILYYGRKDGPRLLNLMRRSRRKGAAKGAFQREVAMFNAMAEFCSDPIQCRHARLLKYFGEDWALGRCGSRCDVCNGEVEAAPAAGAAGGRKRRAAAAAGAAPAKQVRVQGQRQLTSSSGALGLERVPGAAAGAADSAVPLGFVSARAAAAGSGAAGPSSFMSAAAALRQHQETARTKKPASKKAAPAPQKSTLLDCIQRASKPPP